MGERRRERTKEKGGREEGRGGGGRNGAAVSYAPYSAACTNCAECAVHTEPEQNGVRQD